jgi:excisionase family DNA binding protein
VPDAGLKSADETALFLGIHPETLRRLHRSGRVPAYMAGRALRFDIEEVRDALRADSHASARVRSHMPDFDALTEP